jgi:hypothetical protein
MPGSLSFLHGIDILTRSVLTLYRAAQQHRPIVFGPRTRRSRPIPGAWAVPPRGPCGPSAHRAPRSRRPRAAPCTRYHPEDGDLTVEEWIRRAEPAALEALHDEADDPDLTHGIPTGTSRSRSPVRWDKRNGERERGWFRVAGPVVVSRSGRSRRLYAPVFLSAVMSFMAPCQHMACPLHPRTSTASSSIHTT